VFCTNVYCSQYGRGRAGSRPEFVLLVGQDALVHLGRF
jgi:hypothetical protein